MARRSSEVPPLSRRRQREEQGLPPFPLPFVVHGLSWWVRLGFLLLAAICIALGVAGFLLDAVVMGIFWLLWGVSFLVAAATARSVVLHEDHLKISRWFRSQVVRYSGIKAIHAGASEIRDITVERHDGSKVRFLLMENPTHQRVIRNWLRSRIAGAAFE